MRWTSKKAAPFVALVCVLALVGCGSQDDNSTDCAVGEYYDTSSESCKTPETETDTGSENEEGSGETDTGSEGESEDTDTQSEGDDDTGGYYMDTDAECITDGDLEGVFPEENMYEYLDCVIPSVDAWIDTVYNSMPHPEGYVYILPDAEVEMACDPGTADDMSAHYCPADKTVYIGHERLWGFYSVLGDSSAFVVLAHEVGHHFEAEVGVYDELSVLSGGGEISPENTVIAENAADCIAGTFMNYMADSGVLNGEEDLNDIAATLAAIADAEREGRNHGRLDERINSFFLGFDSQLEQPMFSCNELVPAEAPLIGEAE